MLWRYAAHVVAVLLNVFHADCYSVSLQDSVSAGIDALLSSGDDATLAGIDAFAGAAAASDVASGHSAAEGDDRPVRKQRDQNRRLQPPKMSGDAQEPESNTASAEPAPPGAPLEPAPAPVQAAVEPVPAAAPAVEPAMSPVGALDKETVNYWRRQSAVEAERVGLVSDLDAANIRLNREHDQLKREIGLLQTENASDVYAIRSMEMKHESGMAQLKRQVRRLSDEVEKSKSTLNLESSELKGQIVTAQVVHDELIKNVDELTQKKMELEGRLAAGAKAASQATQAPVQDADIASLERQRDIATAALVALSIVTVAAGVFHYKDKVFMSFTSGSS